MVTLTKNEIKWLVLEMNRIIPELRSTEHPLSVHYAECYQNVVDKLNAVLDNGYKRIQVV